MDKITNIAQKYHQAPWRTQRQWLGLILLGIVFCAMVAGIYLSVSNRAILYGREVLNLNNEIAKNQRVNADYQREIAENGSVERMRQRAEKLGFEPANPGDMVFMVVPGYPQKTEFSLATTTEAIPGSIIISEYRETLFDWLSREIQGSAASAGGQP